MSDTVDQARVVTENFKVKIAGSPLAGQVEQLLMSVEIEHAMGAPASCQLVFHDQQLELADDTSFDLAKAIEVLGGPNSDVIIFKGEIVEVELRLHLQRTEFVVHAFDQGHRLLRGRKIETFQNVKFSDVVSTVASGAGVSTGTVDSTASVYDHLFRPNTTAWGLLSQLADEVGHDLWLSDGKLNFTKRAMPSSPVAELVYGRDVLRARILLSGAEQSDKVEVRGWDVKNKAAVVGTSGASASSAATLSQTMDSAARSAFGTTTYTAVRAIGTESDATHHAEAIQTRIADAGIGLDLTVIGNPVLALGKAVKLKGFGTRFSATYAIRSCIHRWVQGQGYHTDLRLGTGPQATDTEVPAVAGNVPAAPTGGGAPAHLVVGIVTNLDDPDTLGRVKVKFPWLADDKESTWARLATPFGGPKRGFYAPPEVNDEVVVGFEHGDFNAPFVLGTLWNGKDAPPAGTGGPVVSGGAVDERVWRSVKDHAIGLWEKDDSKGITVKTASNQSIILTSGDEKTVLTLDPQGTTVKIDSQGTVEITATKDVKVKGSDLAFEATSGKIEMKAVSGIKLVNGSGSVEIDAGGNVTAKGLAAKLEGSTQVDVKGAAGATVDGGAMATIKGGMVKIN